MDELLSWDQLVKQFGAARVDPAGCGCTDCLIGESVPFDQASPEQLEAMSWGLIDNATGVTHNRTSEAPEPEAPATIPSVKDDPRFLVLCRDQIDEMQRLAGKQAGERVRLGLMIRKELGL